MGVHDPDLACSGAEVTPPCTWMRAGKSAFGLCQAMALALPSGSDALPPLPATCVHITHHAATLPAGCFTCPRHLHRPRRSGPLPTPAALQARAMKVQPA